MNIRPNVQPKMQLRQLFFHSGLWPEASSFQPSINLVKLKTFLTHSLTRISSE